MEETNRDRLTSVAYHDSRLPRAFPLSTHNHDRPQIIHKVKAVDPQGGMGEPHRRGPELLRVLAGLDHKAGVAGFDEHREEGRVEGRGDEWGEGRG